MAGPSSMDAREPGERKRGLVATCRAAGYGVRIVWRCVPVPLVAVGLATILQGFSPAVTVWISKYVLDAVVRAAQSGGRAAEMGSLFRILALQLAVLTAFMVLSRLAGFARAYLGEKLTLCLRSDALKKISQLDPILFEDARVYDVIYRAQGESGAKPMVLVDKIASTISSGITFVSMAGLIASFSRGMVVAMILLCLPYFLVQLEFGRRYFKLEYQRAHDGRLAGHLYDIMTTRHYVAEIMSFGLWSFLREKWWRIARSFMKQNMRLTAQRSGLEAAISLLVRAANAVAMGYIVYQGVRRAPPCTVGEIMMYAGAFAGGVAALGDSLDSVSGLHQGSLFLQNLIEFYELRSHPGAGRNVRSAPEQIESIELSHVSFRYPGRDEYALKDVSMVFRRPESVLVLGPNGAGKTTLMKLLAGLYEPTEGRILVNGVDVREFDVASYRRRIAVVFQDFVRYALAARENIGCGCVERIDETERVVRAARMARADTLVRALPFQYETILSKEFRNGQDLSLGQWQRICIARLFMKDAPVLIFDEPTASLDIETEAHLLVEIGQLARNRICLLVSHRLLRKDLADRALVLKGGEIVEAGPCDVLLEKNGEYSRLVQLYHSGGETRSVDAQTPVPL
jgi:ATP-binding cassette subfamily B protein